MSGFDSDEDTLVDNGATSLESSSTVGSATDSTRGTGPSQGGLEAEAESPEESVQSLRTVQCELIDDALAAIGDLTEACQAEERVERDTSKKEEYIELQESLSRCRDCWSEAKTQASPGPLGRPEVEGFRSRCAMASTWPSRPISSWDWNQEQDKAWKIITYTPDALLELFELTEIDEQGAHLTLRLDNICLDITNVLANRIARHVTRHASQS